VHVPVYARPPVEILIDSREERVGEQRREDGLGALVQGQGEQDFVDVVGEGGEGERVRPGLGEGE